MLLTAIVALDGVIVAPPVPPPPEPLDVTFTEICFDETPDDDNVIVAEPCDVPLTVTVCVLFQFDEVNVNEDGDTVAFPLTEIDTVWFVHGCLLNLTVNVVEFPLVTLKDVDETTISPYVVEPPPPPVPPFEPPPDDPLLSIFSSVP